MKLIEINCNAVINNPNCKEFYLYFPVDEVDIHQDDKIWCQETKRYTLSDSSFEMLSKVSVVTNFNSKSEFEVERRFINKVGKVFDIDKMQELNFVVRYASLVIVGNHLFIELNCIFKKSL